MLIHHWQICPEAAGLRRLLALGLGMGALQVISFLAGTSVASMAASVSILLLGIALRLLGCPERIVLRNYLAIGPIVAALVAASFSPGLLEWALGAGIGYLIALGFFLSVQEVVSMARRIQ